MNLCNVFKKLHVINLLYYDRILHEKVKLPEKGPKYKIVPLFCPSPQLLTKHVN